MSDNGRSPVPLAVPKPGTLVEAISAIVHPPAIPIAEIDTTLGLYELRRTGRVQNFALGWRSSIVSVPTESGRVVIKRYRDGWDVETIKHEHSILDELERISFPAVRLARPVAGNSFVSNRAGRYVVFEYVRGRSVTGRYMTLGGRKMLFTHIGEVLARLHDALSGFTPPFEHHLGYSSPSGSAPRDLAWHLQAVETLSRFDSAQHPDETGLIDRVRADGAAIEERLVELDRILIDSDLDTGLIHGDFGPHNVIFDRSGQTVVHDFELARVDWRMVDLIGGLSRWSADAGRAYVEGYRRATPGRARDFSMLPLVWEHYRLCGAIQSWHTYRQQGDPARLGTAERRLEEALRLRRAGPPDWLEL